MLVFNDKNRRFDRLVILPAIVVFCNTVPWLNTRLRAYSLLPLMAVYVLLTLFRKKETRLESVKERRAGFSMFLGASVFFLSYLLIRGRTGFYMNWFGVAVISLFLLWVFIRLAAENKAREIKVLALVTLGAIVVASVMNVLFLSDEMNQNVLRDMTGADKNLSQEDAIAAHESGAGGYHTTYVIGLLSIPMLYAGFRVNWKLRIIFWMVSCLSLLYAYRAGFSILMIVIGFGIMICMVAIVIKKFNLFRLAAVSGVVMLLVLTLNPTLFSFAAKPFAALAEMTTNPSYIMRLTSIAEALSGSGDEYATYRPGLLWQSWRMFLENPIWGVGYDISKIGGHSFILDYLAMGGLSLFWPFPLFLYLYTRYLKIVIYPLSPSSRLLIELYFYMYIMCTLLNPLNSVLGWNGFFLTLPGISLLFADSRLNQRRWGRRTPALRMRY